MGRHGENIRKRVDGRWEARLLVGRDKEGKAKYRYFYAKSYKEVREKRKWFQEEMQHQQEIALTVESYNFGQLLDDWLVFIHENVKESTYAKYLFLIERHIRPELGERSVAGLTTADIDAFTKNKLTAGKLKGSGGLSPKTVNSILSIVKLVLIYGEEQGLFPARKLVIHNVKQPLPEIQVLQLSEQSCLESFLFNNMTEENLGILICLYTGLRIGEICALQWGDIDFRTNTLFVRRTLMRIQNTDPHAKSRTKIIINTPKTSKSYRALPLPLFLVRIIREYRRGPEIYVVSGSMRFKEPRSMYASYKRCMKQVGLEKYNFHVLRHTFATRCVENGFDIKSLSEILGHADVNVTLRRYVHPSMELKRQHMERLSQIGICGQFKSQEVVEIL